MIYKHNSKKLRQYPGIDASGESAVMPPTFCGIYELIKRAGGVDQAAAMYPGAEVPDSFETDTVSDFLAELASADKVDRQTLIQDFTEYVKDLESYNHKRPADGGKAKPAGGGGAPANETGDPGEGGGELKEPTTTPGEPVSP